MTESSIREQKILIPPEEIKNAESKFRRLAFNGIEAKTKAHIDLIEKTRHMLLESIHPTAVFCLSNIEVISDTAARLDSHLIESRDFAKRMRDAKKAVVYIATIGEINSDNLSVSEKFLVDCWGAAYVDALSCDIDELIGGMLTEQGLGVSGRYSPGYGDFSIEEQKIVFSLLNGAAIGVELLPSYVMKPLKSISGILAVSWNRGERPQFAKCEDCNISDTCVYRM